MNINTRVYRPWLIPCMKCYANNEFIGTTIKLNSSAGKDLKTTNSLNSVFTCTSCKSDHFGASSAGSCFGYLSNLLTFKIREYKQTYYEG